MKTSEQTKRRISVGLTTLATTALLVMVTAATLFCGVTSARAQEPDNRIDWRWGRPGVMVVTNAPTAVTVTNIATEVAGGVADTMFGPRVTALEDALDGGTNNWNTAYGWGNHAGLYRDIGWVPSWGDITDIPQDFPPSFHQHDYTAVTNAPWLTTFTEQDETALAALASNRVTRWYDPVNNNSWAELDGGTNIVVYQLEISGTNYVINGSFGITGGDSLNLSSAPFPFDSGLFTGRYQDDYTIVLYDGYSIWLNNETEYPKTLMCTMLDIAYGDPVVSIGSYVYGITNELYRYYLPTNAIPPELSSLSALTSWLNTNYATTASVAAKLDRSGGMATNLTTAGWLQLPQTAATNLVLRMWTSNDVIYASEVYQ